MNLKKMSKIANKVITILVFSVLTLMLILVLSARLSGNAVDINGYQLKTVLSGSMEPEIKTGSIIAIKMIREPNVFDVNDVITYKSIDNPNVLITHRIIEVIKTGQKVEYITKGDNNDGKDSAPIPASNVIGEYKGFTIPYIGYGFNFYNTDLGKIFLLIIPGLLLVGWAVTSTLKAIKSIEEPKEANSENH